MKKLLIAAAIALLQLTPALAAPAPGITIKDDKFSAEATFVGPKQSVNPFGGTFRMWFIRSWLNKTDHTVRHQLYVDTTYFWHWRFWETAADDHAVSHPVEKIDASVDDCSGGMCSYSETVGVDLDDAFLRANAVNGFQLKLSAKSGDDLVLTITPQQIQPVLAAIDTYAEAAGAARLPPASPASGVVLGVQGGDAPASLGLMLGRRDLHGALVAVVSPGSVAEKSGIKVGDVVTTYNKLPLRGIIDLQQAVRATTPGSTVSAAALRGSADVTLKLQF